LTVVKHCDATFLAAVLVRIGRDHRLDPRSPVWVVTLDGQDRSVPRVPRRKAHTLGVGKDYDPSQPVVLADKVLVTIANLIDNAIAGLAHYPGEGASMRGCLMLTVITRSLFIVAEPAREAMAKPGTVGRDGQRLTDPLLIPWQR
jgi:nitrogen-specific signal transduction histidine kinase